jgi:hypothetical protein
MLIPRLGIILDDAKFINLNVGSADGVLLWHKIRTRKLLGVVAFDGLC